LSKRLANIVLFAIVLWIWGSTWLAIRLGLQGVPPVTGAAMRMLASGVILLMVAFALRTPWPRERIYLTHLAVQGSLLFCLQYALIYWAEQTVPSGLTAVLFASLPIWTALIATYGFKLEQLSGMNMIGLLVGICGVAVIYWSEVVKTAHIPPLGVMALLLAAASAAFASVFAKRFAHDIPPLATVGPGQLVGGILLVAIALIAERGKSIHFTPVSVGALAYLIIFGSAVVFLAYFTLMKNMTITRLSLLTYVIPVIAVVLGSLIAHERLTAFTFAGAALVIAGIWLVNARQPAAAAHPVAPVTIEGNKG